MLPFTIEKFLSVFQNYNDSIWPFQVVLNLAGLAAVIFVVMRFRGSDKFISAILGFLWIWIGIAYHYFFFSKINPAAYLFAGLNFLQGILFVYYGVVGSRLSFKYNADVYGIAGIVFVVYAMVIYPILGSALGHEFPQAPSFGLPCPTTIFTFGLLMWTVRGVPKVVLLIPVLWSLIGFFAAASLGMMEDIGLIVAGVAGFTMLLVRDRRGNAAAPSVR